MSGAPRPPDGRGGPVRQSASVVLRLALGPVCSALAVVALALRARAVPLAVAAGLAAGLEAGLAAGATQLAVPTTAQPFTQPAPAPQPMPAPPLSARAAALMDVSSGQLLYGYQQDRELPIASTTKLMTALITLERVRRLQTVFVQNDYYPSAVDSQIGLVPGDRMTVHDLLLAMLLPSADDAAEDIAYNVGRGSIPSFVAMMNVRARQLGLRHTHYSTPIGLDTPGNYSTAADLATLTRYLLLHEPFFARAVALPSAALTTGPVRRVSNRNDLVGRVPWINGVKTGHTLQAGYVLVGSATGHGMTLVAPVLGTPSEATRDASTLALLRWGLANFRVLRPVQAGTVLARPAERDRPRVHVSVIAARSYEQVLPRSTALTTQVDVPAALSGPLPRDAVVGQVLVLADGRRLASIPLTLAESVPAVSSLARATALVKRPFTLFVLILLIGGAVGAGMVRRQRARALAATRR